MCTRLLLPYKSRRNVNTVITWLQGQRVGGSAACLGPKGCCGGAPSASSGCRHMEDTGVVKPVRMCIPSLLLLPQVDGISMTTWHDLCILPRCSW